MNVSFEHLLPWFMRECISIFWLECVSLGDTNMPVFLVLKGNSSEDAWKQRQCTEWCKHSNHQCASMWKIVLTTRLFYWHTMASVAQFYNIFRTWFLTMNHHILFNHLLNLAFVFQVWMKTIPKSNSASTLLPDSGMPLSAERIWVFFRFLHRLCFSFSIIWQRDYDDKETEEFMTSCRMSLIRHRRRTLLLCKET